MTTATVENPAEIVDDAPEMEDIVDFIDENKLSMHGLLIHENPYRSKDQQQGAVHWSCKLINAKNQFIIVYFSKGAAIRRWCQPPETGLGVTIPLHVPHDKINASYDGPMPPFENKEDEKKFNLCSQVEPPFLIEVLDILAKDIWLVEQTGHFETWARSLKVSPDSRNARGVFDIVCQQRLELQALLQEEAYHRLLYEIDRINPFIFETDEDDSEAEIEDQVDQEST